MTEYMDFLYIQVEHVVKKAQRNLQRGVLPKDVLPMLPYARAEGSVRRDMLEMNRQGRLVRIGGDGARQGYRVPTLVERVCFEVTRCWPYGCEQPYLGAVR